MLVDSFNTVSIDRKLRRFTGMKNFKRELERYGVEFRIVGKAVYLEVLAGKEIQSQHCHQLKASNIVQEMETSTMWTYAKGYGGYKDAKIMAGVGDNKLDAGKNPKREDLQQH